MFWFCFVPGLLQSFARVEALSKTVQGFLESKDKKAVVEEVKAKVADLTGEDATNGAVYIKVLEKAIEKVRGRVHLLHGCPLKPHTDAFIAALVDILLQVCLLLSSGVAAAYSSMCGAITHRPCSHARTRHGLTVPAVALHVRAG